MTTSVKLAIELLAQNENSLEDKQAIQFLIENGIRENEAVEIIAFLPIAFIRSWLTKVNWKDNYTEYKNEKYVSKKYSETETYNQILKVTEDYFNRNPDKETVMKIAGRSAEFNVINQLLLENPTAKIEDISLTETVIMR
ncbi:hypothetical protein [Flavobacterium wongokense]|uniref:hypothetical protein n=1 Tax=Flavobacterium wongokense TaxID=2910674 RepID=UPI001F34B1D1|nr:hypothetical protein [Flavobacterium sp. WG47]MCF6133452.1 hypothetical protein [Flavobacterium sp. WG47]MCF6133466.1 hypothetical protein [Flavobacterium sp. WG47]